MNELHFKQLLAQKIIAVVHFSHYAVMNHRVSFPHDLIYAIKNYQTETRSCCAVFPDHGMQLPGSVGLILNPKLSQLLSVCGSDSGSSDIGGDEGSLGEEPTEDSILRSLCITDGGYNEWRVRGASPSGIFVADPKNIQAKQKVKYTVEEEQYTDIVSKRICLSQVFEAFPSLHVFTMGFRGLEELPRPRSV